VLVQVLLSRESLAGVSLAVRMRTVDRILGPSMFAMNLSFMPKQTARVCETREILAPLGRASVRPFMLVHVLAVEQLAKFY
jgi:hypothetical protein